MKMRPKVSIDSIDRYHRYRSIDPSPIVPIYVSNYTMNCVVLGKTEEKDINMKSLELTAQCVMVHERQGQF